MNLAISKAMLREQFQRTLLILAVSLGISTALCLTHYASLWRYTPNEELMGFTMFVAHAIGILGLLYCQSDERDMQVIMPEYLLRLPVRTIDLVMLRMFYGLLFVAFIGIWNSAIHYPLYSNHGNPSFGFWTPCIIGITTYATFQALAWSIRGLGIIILVTSNPVLLILSTSFGFVDPATLESIDLSRYTTETVFATLAVSFLVAYVGVRTRRGARVDVSRLLGALPSIVSHERRVEPPPFTSRKQAMHWLEWRRQSRMLPLLVGVGSIFLAIMLLDTINRPPFQASASSAKLAVYRETIAGGWYAVL